MTELAYLIPLSLALVSIGLLTVSYIQFRRCQHQLRLLSCQLASTGSAIRKRQLDLQELRNKKKVLEDSIHTGTTALEAVHRVITSTTFEMIDRWSTSAKFRDSARQAREVHDETSRTFYRSLRSTNKTLHALATIMINKRADRRPTNPDEQ